MKPFLSVTILALCLSLYYSNGAQARRASTGHRHRPNNTDTAQRNTNSAEGVNKKLGVFNYTYLRAATFFPSPGFGNPMASGFAGSEKFALTEDLPNQFRLGYESGKARHFMKLNLGTPMLKFAINSGIALQAFGQGEKTNDGSAAKNNGFYLMKLALGPQFTFKPIKEFRVGLYYRAGIALLYTIYQNEQRTVIGPDRMRIDKADVSFVNYAYQGDLGLDVCYRAISIGLSLQMLKLTPSRGALFSRNGDTDEVNAVTSSIEQSGVQEGNKVITPIDPVVKFNRLCVSVGFAL